jgi:outer membrane protein OmpA-like peptidoglycan-associated protein
LLPDATPLLQKAANFITKYPQASVNVDGYTDSIGTPSYNLTLSEQRAQAVENWLSAHVPPGQYRFHSLGHGASDFVVDPNGTKDQQQENRRVELLVQALKQ